MNVNPMYVKDVANNLRKAIERAILAENTACYFDGTNGTRAEADAAKVVALMFVDDLERAVD